MRNLPEVLRKNYSAAARVPSVLCLQLCCAAHTHAHAHRLYVSKSWA